MASSNIESIWKLMSEHALEVESGSTNIDLTCGICNKLMIDACQTVCGCQYCYKCVSEYLSDGDKYCPGQKEGCKEEKLKLDHHIFKNSFFNKKILTTKVRCPNQSCVCYIVLTQMEDHLRECTELRIECPFVQIGCDNEGASKDVIVTHLQNETFTHSQLLIELIHNLKNEVDELKDKFGISQLEISSLRGELTLKDVQIKLRIDDQKREMDEQKRQLDCVKEESRDRKNLMMTYEKELRILRNEMELKLTAIEKETKKIKAEMDEQKREMDIVKKKSQKNENFMMTLEKELRIFRNEMELRLTAIKEGKEKRDAEMEKQKCDMDIVKKDSQKNKNLMEIRKRDITVQMKEQKCEMESVKEELKKRESTMRTLEEELGKLRNEVKLTLTAMIGETEKSEREMGEQRRSIDDMKNEMREEREKFDEDGERRMRNWIKWNKLLPNIDVDFLWRIDEITKKMSTMGCQRIYSESFSSNNYKLCLYIYICDDRDDIVLYCNIMQGDNDDKLQWPMKLRVRLSIVNQDTLRTHKSGTTMYDTDKYNNKRAFDRPLRDMNQYGIYVRETFIKYSSIKDDKSVLVNDSFIVSCAIGDRN